VTADRRRELLGVAIVFVFLAYLVTAATWADPTHHWVGSCCDPEQSVWYLAWLPSAIEHGQNPFLTDRLNAPAGANLMWNAANPFVALAVLPLTVTVGPVFAYNVALLAGVALNGITAFLALRRYARQPLGPLVGGVVYALSPFVVSHAVLHLNLVMAWTPPLFLILLDELVVRRRHRPVVLGVWIGVLAAVQLLIFEEVLATTAVTGVVLLLVLAAVARNRSLITEGVERLARAAIPALLAFLAIGGVPLAVQFFGPQQLHGRVQDPAIFSTDFLNFVLPTSYQLLAPSFATDVSRHFSGLFHEATGYIGLPLLAVLGWIVIRLRGDRRVVVGIAVAVVMAVCSLGPELHVGGADWHVPLPWLPFTWLPLLEHATPGRLTLYVWLAIAAVLAVGIDHALATTDRWRLPRLAAIGLAILVVAPAPLASTAKPVPASFASWSQQGIADTDTILFAPWFTNGAGADPMLWAAVADARPKMHEGYVYVPGTDGRPQYGPTAELVGRAMIQIQDLGAGIGLSPSSRQAMLAELAADGIDDVIVGPMNHRDLMVDFFTRLLGAPPEQQDGIQLWRNVRAVTAAEAAAG
jgi:hypothetical protein